MSKKRTIIIAIILAMIFSAVSVYAASGNSLMKELFGEDAPELPGSPKTTTEFYYDDGESHEIDGYEEIDAFFEYLEKNDPDFYDGGTVDDLRPGDIALLNAIDEMNQNNNIKNLYDEAEAVSDAFSAELKRIEKLQDSRIDSGEVDESQRILRVFSPMYMLESVYLGVMDNEWSEDELRQAVETSTLLFDASNIAIKKTEDNNYAITFEGVTRDENNRKHHNSTVINILADCESRRLKMHVEETTPDMDKYTFSMYEFAELGDDTYAFQTAFDRLIIKYDSEGNVGDFMYSVRNNSETYFTQADSIYENVPTDYENWVRADGDNSSVVIKTGGTTVFELNGKEQIVVNQSFFSSIL